MISFFFLRHQGTKRIQTMLLSSLIMVNLFSFFSFVSVCKVEENEENLKVRSHLSLLTEFLPVSSLVLIGFYAVCNFTWWRKIPHANFASGSVGQTNLSHWLTESCSVRKSDFSLSFSIYTIDNWLTLLTWPHLKGIVHPKIKILSLITHPHVFPNP